VFPDDDAARTQLQNVVSLFSTDNNGVLVQLPALTASGAATASGSLIFGINTQTNNALDMTAVVFPVDPATGYVSTTTTYGSTSNPSSYVDSGSNGWFFDDRPSRSAAPAPPLLIAPG